MCLWFDGACVGLCVSDACVGCDRCAAATAVCTREGVQERTAGRAEQRQSRGWGIRAHAAGLCSEGFARAALLRSITKFSAGSFYFGCFSAHFCSHLLPGWASGPPNCGSPALVEEHRQEKERFPWKPLDAQQQVAGSCHVTRCINQTCCMNQVSRGQSPARSPFTLLDRKSVV